MYRPCSFSQFTRVVPSPVESGPKGKRCTALYAPLNLASQLVYNRQIGNRSQCCDALHRVTRVDLYSWIPRSTSAPKSLIEKREQARWVRLTISDWSLWLIGCFPGEARTHFATATAVRGPVETPVAYRQRRIRSKLRLCLTETCSLSGQQTGQQTACCRPGHFLPICDVAQRVQPRIVMDTPCFAAGVLRLPVSLETVSPNAI
jgi:hypothetical protein